MTNPRSSQPKFCISFDEDDTDLDYDKRCINGLLEAIVERALRDALGNTHIDRHVMMEARQWLHSKETKFWAFLWIVDELQLSSNFVKRVRNLIPQHTSLPLVRTHNGFQVQVLIDPRVTNVLHRPIVLCKVGRPALLLSQSRRKRL